MRQNKQVRAALFVCVHQTAQGTFKASDVWMTTQRAEMSHLYDEEAAVAAAAGEAFPALQCKPQQKFPARVQQKWRGWLRKMAAVTISASHVCAKLNKKTCESPGKWRKRGGAGPESDTAFGACGAEAAAVVLT